MKFPFRKIYRFATRVVRVCRNFFWSKLFASFGEGSSIFGHITVYSPEKVEFGTMSTINVGSVINARGGIIVGDHVHISPGVIINTGGLDYKNTLDKRKHTSQQVVIKDGAWIGSGVCINPGVTIGKNSVIGAGAVVTKNIPDDVVAVGVPAKVLNKIFD